MLNTSGAVILAMAICSLAVQTSEAGEEPRRLPPESTPLPSPLHCPVEGDIVEGQRYGVIWKGRRYFMDSEACLDVFMADPEKYARDVEPRAALVSAPLPDRPSYSPLFLFLSFFVVAGLISGAVSSYIGIQKGFPGRTWFVTGFFLNVVAIVLVLHCRGQEVLFSKKGLCKTPETYDPVPHACGATNHPSANRCHGCGRDLQPAVSSEVERVR